MSASILFVTANDTGVGKTVLSSLLTRRMLDRGIAVRAVKPACSGSRSDSVILRTALRNAVPLDEVNPWHFKAPLAPTLAARREGRKLELGPVLKFLRGSVRKGELLLIEGAGGLLSPYGEGFTSLDLIRQLRARPLVVCPNRLGAVNQTSLVLSALPAALRRQAIVVLVQPARPDLSTRDNAKLIKEFTGAVPLEFPRVAQPATLESALRNPRVRRAVDAIIQRLG
jgi:dethiobiotin synthetase